MPSATLFRRSGSGIWPICMSSWIRCISVPNSPTFDACNPSIRGSISTVAFDRKGQNGPTGVNAISNREDDVDRDRLPHCDDDTLDIVLDIPSPFPQILETSLVLTPKSRVNEFVSLTRRATTHTTSFQFNRDIVAKLNSRSAGFLYGMS